MENGWRLIGGDGLSSAQLLALSNIGVVWKYSPSASDISPLVLVAFPLRLHFFAQRFSLPLHFEAKPIDSEKDFSCGASWGPSNGNRPWGFGLSLEIMRGRTWNSCPGFRLFVIFLEVAIAERYHNYCGSMSWIECIIDQLPSGYDEQFAMERSTIL